MPAVWRGNCAVRVGLNSSDAVGGIIDTEFAAIGLAVGIQEILGYILDIV